MITQPNKKCINHLTQRCNNLFFYFFAKLYIPQKYNVVLGQVKLIILVQYTVKNTIITVFFLKIISDLLKFAFFATKEINQSCFANIYNIQSGKNRSLTIIRVKMFFSETACQIFFCSSLFMNYRYNSLSLLRKTKKTSMSAIVSEDIRKVTTSRLMEMKQRGEKISMLTAYDFSMAQIIDQAGMDVILVGDSASNVMAGNVTTLPITLDQMIYHGKSVVKAVKRALVVVDLPFGSYQGDSKEALKSAIRVMKETHADCIKIEGGAEIRESIERILCAGIPIMGHLGLTPQSINKFGTYVVRAREEEEAKKLIKDAHLLEELGCFGIVVEKIPATLASRVASELRIPIIGIGAGGGVDGQVLVMHDMLGINREFSPRFLRRYANLYEMILQAVQSYIVDVKKRDFPNEKEQY